MRMAGMPLRCFQILLLKKYTSLNILTFTQATCIKMFNFLIFISNFTSPHFGWILFRSNSIILRQTSPFVIDTRTLMVVCNRVSESNMLMYLWCLLPLDAFPALDSQRTSWEAIFSLWQTLCPTRRNLCFLIFADIDGKTLCSSLCTTQWAHSLFE